MDDDEQFSSSLSDDEIEYLHSHFSVNSVRGIDDELMGKNGFKTAMKRISKENKTYKWPNNKDLGGMYETYNEAAGGGGISFEQFTIMYARIKTQAVPSTKRRSSFSWMK